MIYESSAAAEGEITMNVSFKNVIGLKQYSENVK